RLNKLPEGKVLDVTGITETFTGAKTVNQPTEKSDLIFVSNGLASRNLSDLQFVVDNLGLDAQFAEEFREEQMNREEKLPGERTSRTRAESASLPSSMTPKRSPRQRTSPTTPRRR